MFKWTDWWRHISACLLVTYWCARGRNTVCSWPAGWSHLQLSEGWTAVPPHSRSSCWFGCWNTFQGSVVWTTGGPLDGLPVLHIDSQCWTQTWGGTAKNITVHRHLAGDKHFIEHHTAVVTWCVWKSRQMEQYGGCWPMLLLYSLSAWGLNGRLCQSHVRGFAHSSFSSCSGSMSTYMSANTDVGLKKCGDVATNQIML